MPALRIENVTTQEGQWGDVDPDGAGGWRGRSGDMPSTGGEHLQLGRGLPGGGAPRRRHGARRSHTGSPRGAASRDAPAPLTGDPPQLASRSSSTTKPGPLGDRCEHRVLKDGTGSSVRGIDDLGLDAVASKPVGRLQREVVHVADGDDRDVGPLTADHGATADNPAIATVSKVIAAVVRRPPHKPDVAQLPVLTRSTGRVPQ